MPSSILTALRRRPITTSLFVLIAFLVTLSLVPHPNSSSDHYTPLGHHAVTAAANLFTSSTTSSPSSDHLFPASSCSNASTGGCPYTALTVDYSTVFDLAVGEFVEQDRSVYEENSGIFNPALLRMPLGSRYEFLVVARGLSKVLFIDNKLSMPRTLVAWFANLEGDSKLIQKGRAVQLNLASNSSAGCEFPWNATPGPEDPRLLWSLPSASASTSYSPQVPVLILGMDTTRPEACRTMGIMDLRTLWPELKAELKRLELHGGKLDESDVVGGEGEVWEHVQKETVEEVDSMDWLTKGNEVVFDGIGNREKNWAAFYSPFETYPRKGATLPLPTFHYSIVPNQELIIPSTFQSPIQTAPILYERLIPPPTEDIYTLPDGSTKTVRYSENTLGKCLARVLDQEDRPGNKVGDHHATPFYPVTLKTRAEASRINSTDTVLVGLSHSKRMLFDDPQLWQYDQYLIVLNATSPYAPLGISPVFHYTGLSHKFYFSQSLTFLPIDPSSLHPSPSSTEPSTTNAFSWLSSLSFPSFHSSPSNDENDDVPTISLSHGFIDDDVLIAEGEGDNAMGVVRMSVKSLLMNVQSCEEVVMGTGAKVDDEGEVPKLVLDTSRPMAKLFDL